MKTLGEQSRQERMETLTHAPLVPRDTLRARLAAHDGASSSGPLAAEEGSGKRYGRLFQRTPGITPR